MASQCIPSLCGDTREPLEQQIHTSQHHKYTKVVLSSGFMWWNELWPGSADPPQPLHFNTRTQLCGKEETHSHIWQSASIATTARRGRETLSLSSSATSPSLHPKKESPCPAHHVTYTSGTRRTSTLLYYFTPVWPELSVTLDSVKLRVYRPACVRLFCFPQRFHVLMMM